MSNSFPYPGDSSIIIQDGTIIWNESHDQSSLQYIDANDTTLEDSTVNESYVTAIDSNETQYLSILESSNDITLDDLHNLTIGNAEAQDNVVYTEEEPTSSETNNEDAETSQVVVFTVDGSDELFGIQIAQDEQGNLQKYQFQFRSTADGQLEAIPETIELLPNDEPAVSEDSAETCVLESQEAEEAQPAEASEYSALIKRQISSNDFVANKDENESQIFIKGEQHSPIPFEEQEDNQDQLQEALETDNVQQKEDIEGYENDMQFSEHPVNIKSEILERALQSKDSKPHYISHPTTNNIKQEQLSVDYLDHPYNDQNNMFNDGVHNYNESEQDQQDTNNQTVQNDDFEQSVEQQKIINIETFGQHTIVNIKEMPDDDQDSFEEDVQENIISIKERPETPDDDLDDQYQQEVIDDGQGIVEEELVRQFESDEEDVEDQQKSEDQGQNSSSNSHYEHVYIQEREFRTIKNNRDEEDNDKQREYSNRYIDEANSNVNDIDSDNEQYQIVEGLHITGELSEESDDQLQPTNSFQPIFHEVIERDHQSTIKKTNILKHSVGNEAKDSDLKRPLVSVKYYVVYPEKENVNSLLGNTITHLDKPSKTNPRSVLRTSFAKPKEPEIQKVITNNYPDIDLFHKRFARSKEAVQAKLFHNFINRTTIPHAPVRQKRQPRKQEIKPVFERRDEEIIVKEVMVSANGFIESTDRNIKNRNKLAVTAVVEITDSEDESSSKIHNTRRKTHQNHRRVISESENSVIVIRSDDEDASVTKPTETESVLKTIGQISTLKRRRGRPPKNKIPIPNPGLSPSKRNRTKSDDIEIDKLEIACPHCPKTFPSQNSLNTHIQHHNLENSLKNKTNMNPRISHIPRKSVLPKIEYNHKCNECQQTFKNSILLQRHSCVKKQTSLICSVCLKQFRDLTVLNIHKKSHVKSNLVSNTSVNKISPKKALHQPSTNLMKSSKIKSPKKPIVSTFKCKQCPKICDSAVNLTAHVKTHKKFLCASCSSSFSSRLLLDTHVRTNCVKIRSPANKRLSFKIRKSFIHTPPRLMSVIKSPGKPLNTTLNQSIASLKLECEVCKLKFSTYRNLFTHKVQKHGLNTPDKSLMDKPKKSLYKPKGAHGGVPANDRMKKAYAALRKKLAEAQDESNIVE